MKTISEFVAEAGARADSVPAFVIEVIKSLEDRVAALEPKQTAKQSTANDLSGSQQASQNYVASQQSQATKNQAAIEDHFPGSDRAMPLPKPATTE